MNEIRYIDDDFLDFVDKEARWAIRNKLIIDTVLLSNEDYKTVNLALFGEDLEQYQFLPKQIRTGIGVITLKEDDQLQNGHATVFYKSPSKRWLKK